VHAVTRFANCDGNLHGCEAAHQPGLLDGALEQTEQIPQRRHRIESCPATASGSGSFCRHREPDAMVYVSAGVTFMLPASISISTPTASPAAAPWPPARRRPARA
jgi:hypothetical protein